MTALEELAQIAQQIRDHDTARSELVKRRDELIDQVGREGATWTQIQVAAGLSPRGVQLARKRNERT